MTLSLLSQVFYIERRPFRSFQIPNLFEGSKQETSDKHHETEEEDDDYMPLQPRHLVTSYL